MKIFKELEWLKDEEINIWITWSLSEPQHTHEFLEFVYILEGEMTHWIDGVEYHCHKGTLLYINCGETHRFTADNKVRYYNLIISPEKFKIFSSARKTVQEVFSEYGISGFSLKWKELPPFVQFSGTKIMEVENILQYMLNEYTSRDVGYYMIMKNQMMTLLIELSRGLRKKNNARKQYRGSIEFYKIKQYIDGNYLEKLTLQELSKKFFCSTSYLSRLFKQYVGKSFIQYLQEKRIEKAMELLRTTNLSVEEIAYKVGYEDKSQLFLTFKKYLNKTPKQYQNENT